MGLHIEITDEAKKTIARQRIKNTVSAVVTVTLTLVLFGICFYLMKIVLSSPDKPEIVQYTASEGDNADPETPEVTVTAQRPTAATAATVRVIASTTPSDLAIVSPDIAVDIPSADLSSGLDVSQNVTVAVAGGGLPGIVSARCDPADRLKRIRESGGVEACEDVVVKSLNWLKSQQSSDGSWGDGPYKAALTGITLLSFLSHCETPMSENYGVEVLNGITYLCNLAKNSKYTSSTPGDRAVCYDHAVATYALCEAYTFCKQMNIPKLEALEEAAIKSVQAILDAQQPNGGWGYFYKDTNIDSSVVAWNIQALKAADHSRLPIKTTSRKGSIKKALSDAGKYMKTCATPDGRFKYQAADATFRPAMIGVGILSLQMTGNASSTEARKALDNIKKDYATPINWSNNDPTTDLYNQYYIVQAAMNRQGDVWDTYNKSFRDGLIKLQGGDGKFNKPGYNQHGSWNVVSQNNKAADIYRQGLATLTMAVYYRFLPGTGEGTRNMD